QPCGTAAAVPSRKPSARWFLVDELLGLADEAGDGLFHVRDHGFTGERLLQVMRTGEEIAVTVFQVAGHEKDFHIGKELLEAHGKFWAAHARHDDIGEYELDGVSEALCGFERFMAILRGEHAEAGRGEKFAGQLAHALLVFYEENGARRVCRE